MRDLLRDENAAPQMYWINTSSNSIVKRFIHKAKKSTKREIKQLMAVRSVMKKIKAELTYGEWDKSIYNLWSVIFTIGYLTQRVHDGEKTYLQGDRKIYRRAVLNREVHGMFVSQIQEWFTEEVVEKDQYILKEFCSVFKNGDADTVQELFNAYLMKTISVRDT